MTEAAPTTTDGMRQALDRLAGQFASALGSLDPVHIDRAITDVLEQTAHALNVDHASLPGSTGEAGPALAGWPGDVLDRLLDPHRSDGGRASTS